MGVSSIVSNLDEYLSNEQKFLKILEDAETWRKVPILNYIPIKELKDHTLVRFRGMIQDMLDPEIYLERYQVVNSFDEGSKRFLNGKYRDCLDHLSNEKINFECKDNVHGERRTLFVVSLPGINSWASGIEENVCITNLNKQIGIDSDHEMENENNEKLSASPQVPKLSESFLLNSPIISRPSKACMVKLYSDFDKYSLNSIVDVVGFLNVDPALDYTASDSDEFQSNIEMQAQNPPPSLIPRVHVVAVKKLNHSNPLLDPTITEQKTTDLNLAVICKDLKIILAQCLFGDDLSAEYLLLHLLSTVYIRSEINSIGKFALNICNLPQHIPPNYSQEFYKILELLLPASHYIPMTLEIMNNLNFFPKKDYETCKLVSGVLQLAPKTHLVLDETQMTPGVLDSNGVKAMQSLSHLIKTQQMKCDFSYYDIDYEVDIPVLILSEGKSILPNDFLLPLNPKVFCIDVIEETLEAAKHYAKPKLSAIRRYITAGKMCSFSIQRNDSDIIEADFVEMRKHDSTIGADELHKLLLLTRLLAISNGKTEFHRIYWEQAKKLEELRKARIKDMPKSNRHV